MNDKKVHTHGKRQEMFRILPRLAIEYNNKMELTHLNVLKSVSWASIIG